jgi:hypothetical protein
MILPAYRITYENGTQYVTSMSATLAEATTYFLGSYFNVGTYPVEDMQKVVKVEEV